MSSSSSVSSSVDATAAAATGSEPHWWEKLHDGTTVLIRPIHGDDLEIERRFIERLSPESRHFRFLADLKTPSAALLHQFTHPDPTREAAFIAVIADGSEKREIGVARYSASADGSTCECAVTVSDEWQHHGLGTLLMKHLIDTARGHGIASMYSIDEAENSAMRDLAVHLGFARKIDPNDACQVIHTLDLRAANA